MKITIERIGVESAPVVQKIYDQSPSYFLNTEHAKASSDQAMKDLCDQVPEEKRTESYEKIFALIRVNDEAIGIVDLHINHPRPGMIYVGLLLLSESHQKKGLGRSCFAKVEEFILLNTQCRTIRLGVSTDNDVEGFWKQLGFERNGHTYEWKGANRVNQVFELEKTL